MVRSRIPGSVLKRDVFPLEEHVGVHLVGQDDDVVLDGDFRNGFEFVSRQCPAGGVVRIVQDEEAGLLGDARAQVVRREAEIVFLQYRKRHGLRTRVERHGLIDRKTRVRVDHLIARPRRGHDGVVEKRLAPRTDHDLTRGILPPPVATEPLTSGFPKLQNTGGWAIVRLARLELRIRLLDDARGRVEIGIADLQVDDVPALPLHFARLGENHERAFPF